MPRENATIGFLTGKFPGEFQVLAALNNTGEFIEPEDFDAIVEYTRSIFQQCVGNKIAVTIETRQDVDDFIILERE